MNKILDAIDKHKFGLLAALTVYVAFFIYANFGSYTKHYPIEPFHDGAYIEDAEDVIELNNQDIEIPEDYNSGDIKNTNRDVNDTREQSYDDYSGSAQDVQQSVYDLERQMYEEAGGAEERERIRQQMEDRQNQQSSTQTNTQTNTNNSSSNQYSGKTLVYTNVPDRKSRYAPAPGYLSERSGVVVVNIKVNQQGYVTSAVYDATRSSNASQRMIDKSIEYAKKSKFAPSSSAPKTQSGYIQYTFVSE